MKLSEFSIKRPVTITMVMLIIIILGTVSLTRLNVDLLPDINIPVAVVSTTYNGAGPKEVEEVVTKNIEDTMATVSNVESINSISSEGNSLVILEFIDGTDMDFATLEMREKLDMIEGMLPDGVGSPLVLKLDPNMLPIMSFAVSYKDKDMNTTRSWVEDVLKPRIERVEGVASVTVSGGAQREVQVIADTDLLSANGITFNQIVDAIRMDNINMPGGTISEGQYDLLVRITGKFESLEDIENIQIFNQDGAKFLLKDLCEVKYADKQESTYSKINGEDSISISVQKESNANTVKVSENVNREIKEILEEYKQVNIITILDQAEFINLSISTVAESALLGGLLAALILLIFLKDIAPTMVIVTSIPISVIGTFILIYYSQITLNIISLGGLALGVGMLVDNSIVVLENIYRMRQEGLSRQDAAIQGSNQVAMAITASTLTTISVFVPIIFIQGITAEIFKQMALTVTFSLIASLIVALTLVPMLSSRLIKRKKRTIRDWVLPWIKDKYKIMLNWSIRHRASAMLIGLAVFVLSLISAFFIGAEFFPTVDQGQINIEVNMPKGTRFEETVDTMKQVEDIIRSIPEIETVASSISANQMFSGYTSSEGNSSINAILKPIDQRNRSTQDVAQQIREKVKQIPGADINVDSGGSIMAGAAGGITGAPISISIEGDNIDVLRDISFDVVDIVKRVQGVAEASSSYEEGSPELRVVIDRQKASQYGINVALVSSSIQSFLQGSVATRYSIDGKEMDVRVQVENIDELSLSDVEKLPVQSPLGMTVPLKNIADIYREKGPVQIQRDDQSRVVNVSVYINQRDLASVVQDIQSELDNYSLPGGYNIYVKGENEQLVEAFDDLKMALILGAVLVYMIMASQFESLVHPFTIMFSVPLALSGAFFALFITGQALNVPGILGMVVLIGIVVNNGIVLVDYINNLREEGCDRTSAVLKAGMVRLRPILMTALTTILGLIPLAVRSGEGAELEKPLAISVIGGLILSTVLTLIIIPVIYTLFDDIAQKFKSKR